MSNKLELIEHINQVTGWSISPRYFAIHEDSTDWMSIKRGDLMLLSDRYFIVRGNMRETRFGIDEQPKMWVFSALDYETGKEMILKTEFREEFYAHIGILKIKCYRSWEKESSALEALKGDMRFMQGVSLRDGKGRNVRALDFIKGKTFFNYIPSINKSHEEYYFSDYKEVLSNVISSIEAISYMHQLGFIHGDIRNDHIIIDSSTGKYRWIDFDLKQDVRDFDLWSLGNVLSFATAKGIVTFDQLLKSTKYDNELKQSLTNEDSSAFYKYRVINLKKVFPYIHQEINDILMHFSTKPVDYYSKISQLLDDLKSFHAKIN